jgi:hypothetical protein
MKSLRQLICEYFYGDHLLGRGSVFQLGYDESIAQWIYLVWCKRCDSLSIMDRATLDKTVFKKEEEGDKPSGNS